MVNITEKTQDIIKVSFFANIIIFLVAIFYSPKWLLITTGLTNIALSGSYMVLKKWGWMFGMMSQTSKLGKGLDNLLGVAYG